VLLEFERPEMWLKKFEIGNRKGREQQIAFSWHSALQPQAGARAVSQAPTPVGEWSVMIDLTPKAMCWPVDYFLGYVE
jgi:hypothetical protein